MQKGERQVADTLDGIRPDHVKRYEWVASRHSNPELAVIDMGCGVGYGSYILAKSGMAVTALEIDSDALSHATQHFNHEHIRWHQYDIALGTRELGRADIAVAFEVIEHMPNPVECLRECDAGLLYASVPNELVFPYNNRYKFHYRHYTPEEFEGLLNDAGWNVVGWYGQTDKVDDVETAIQGRTLIAVCERPMHGEAITHCPIKLPDAEPVKPRSVAIVAMGETVREYVLLCSNTGNRHKICDEVWAINNMATVIEHDRIFAMDDLAVQEQRAIERPDSSIPCLLTTLRHSKGFYTSRVYEDGKLGNDYPAIEYPLEEICNSIGHTYFNSTVAYAVAMAIHEGFETIYLFGIEFSYPDRHIAEKGRACVEFLLGIASQRGITIALPETTAIMDANVPANEKPYGYDTEDISFEYKDGHTIVKRTPKEVVPSVDEIEKRYRKTIGEDK